MEQDPFSSALIRQTLLSGALADAVYPGCSDKDDRFDPDNELCPDVAAVKAWQGYQLYRRYYCLDQLPAAVYRVNCVFSDPYEVFYQTWLPETEHIRGTFYLLHGYYDHTGLYTHLIEALLLQGYAVVAPDLPGHGLSSGSRASIISFSEYTQALWDVMCSSRHQLPEPLHLIGQSTGGAILTDWWLNHKYHVETDIRCTIMLAPLVRPWNWSQGLFSYHLLSPFLKQVKRSYSRNSHNEHFLRFLREDPLQPRYLATDWVGALKNWIEQTEQADPVSVPLLIIQGEEDKTVDWRFNVKFLQQKFVESEVRFYPSARHHLVNESFRIRQQWLTRLRYYLDHL